MAKSLKQRVTFQIQSDDQSVPEIVQHIQEARGLAYSKFSGRPISLCKSLERRGELRVKFEEPIYLWPVELEDTVAVAVQSQPIVAVSRDISPHGVGFSYDEKFETDHVVAEFDLFGKGAIHLLIDVRWETQIEPHAFVGGGLILNRVTEVRLTSG